MRNARIRFAGLQGHGQFFADERGQVQVRRDGQGVDVERLQLIDAFAAGETFRHQRFRQRRVLHARQREQAGVLREAGAESCAAEGNRSDAPIKAA